MSLTCQPISMAGFVLWVMVCLALGCDHYVYEGGKQRYFAAERGRLIQYVIVVIHNTNDPFGPWNDALVEPCETVSKAVPTSVPCWPKDALRRDQRLL